MEIGKQTPIQQVMSKITLSIELQVALAGDGLFRPRCRRPETGDRITPTPHPTHKPRGWTTQDVKLGVPSLPQGKEDTEEWTYPMRREVQEILPGLFLGPYSSATKSKLPILQKHGINPIICIRQNIEANFVKSTFQQLFRYLVLDIADNPVANIIQYFPMIKEFTDGEKVLVHGNAGIARSAASVIAYIMETFVMKYRDAFAYVQERRFCINPNAGFVHQLEEYEAIYLTKLIQIMSAHKIERSLSVHSGLTGSLQRTQEEKDGLGNMHVVTAKNGRLKSNIIGDVNFYLGRRKY
ncbi:LOW QUALITY PROTEIN: serine/threonine/tyrosine-interacting protein-like [Mirounga leonina]|uniref:LOW QUALITY PROTEIN: serine/threonine/tyrosine-interacting protein-like n=1 Tax=Mirounga leonina TaxID=9715 RepID=UPI00156C0D2D|nr:LOW QUALITY PROTEIN: serine/threonine/tyrosine-interacting protein-like [Mirounga leonina]